MLGGVSGERSVFPGFADLDGLNVEIGQALARRRRALGLSQAGLAAEMGTSQPAIARLERGRTNARLSTLVRYADAVGCTLRVELTEAAS